MKKINKIFALVIMAIVGITFAGCGETTTNAIAYNIENEVKTLNSMVKSIKTIKEEDIKINNMFSNNYTNKSAKNISKIKNTPKQTAKTQIVRNENLVLAAAPKAEKIDYVSLLSNKEGRTVTAKASWRIMPKKKNNSEIDKVARQSVNNSINNNKVGVRRLTTGSYVPRRISELDYSNADLANYISKIEDLYLMMNDAICANNDCENLKNNILTNCNMLNLLCKELRNKKINLNNNQCDACKDLLSNLNSNINTLNKCKNESYNECSGIKKMSAVSDTSLEQMNAKYVTLINCLDNQITCYANILSILTNLRCTITGVCGEENKEIVKNEENKTEEQKEIVNGENKTEEQKEVLNEKKTDNVEQKIDEKDKEFTTLETKELVEEDKFSDEKQIEDKKEDNLVVMPRKQEDNLVNIVNKRNEIKPIVDYSDNHDQTRKNNLDTYRNNTINPNLDNNLNRNGQNTLNNNKTENTTPPVTNTNPVVNNGINNNGINNTNTFNNGGYVNSINPIANGVNPGMNGYGIHNYENGVVNPYRNTDTYKFPTGMRNNQYANGYGNAVAKIEPLRSETRQNFKTFN